MHEDIILHVLVNHEVLYYQMFLDRPRIEPVILSMVFRAFTPVAIWTLFRAYITHNKIFVPIITTHSYWVNYLKATKFMRQ